jgi:hypothetical protein
MLILLRRRRPNSVYYFPFNFASNLQPMIASVLWPSTLDSSAGQFKLEALNPVFGPSLSPAANLSVCIGLGYLPNYNSPIYPWNGTRVNVNFAAWNILPTVLPNMNARWFLWDVWLDDAPAGAVYANVSMSIRNI